MDLLLPPGPSRTGTAGPGLAGPLPDVDQEGAGRGQAQELGKDQTVVDHDLGPPEHVGPPPGDQTRIPGSGPHQVDGHRPDSARPAPSRRGPARRGREGPGPVRRPSSTGSSPASPPPQQDPAVPAGQHALRGRARPPRSRTPRSRMLRSRRTRKGWREPRPGASSRCPGLPRKARSARTARWAGGVVDGAEQPADLVVADPALDGQGTLGHLGEQGARLRGSRRSRPVRPSRSRAATATTPAPSWAARSSRVAMFPRSSAKVRSGRSQASWARRRTDPVATVAPAGRSASRDPTRASRGSARSGIQARRRPSGVVEGRSLAEWTARSARPSRTAVLDVGDEGPLTPDLFDGDVGQPVAPGGETTISQSRAVGKGPEQAATRAACHRASGDPRVARRRRVAI